MMKMDKEQAEKLIKKFMDGSTTTDEESALYSYFASGDADDDLAEWKDYFLAFGLLRDTVDERAEESPTNVVAMERRHKEWHRIAAAAAVIIVLVVAAMGIYRSQNYCEAYVYGRKVTNEKVVMKEMNATLKEIDDGDQPTVDAQLKDVLM